MNALSIKAFNNNNHGCFQGAFATCRASWGCLHCSKHVSFRLAMNNI